MSAAKAMDAKGELPDQVLGCGQAPRSANIGWMNNNQMELDMTD
jgi:hypothetical protein